MRHGQSALAGYEAAAGYEPVVMALRSTMTLRSTKFDETACGAGRIARPTRSRAKSPREESVRDLSGNDI
jgi:hypothetical protein